MTTTGLTVFDDTIHATNTWLHEIGSRMVWDDRRKAYRLLRTSLHAIRDRLPPTAAAHLAAQLPLLMRGVFYEGWRPSEVPKKTRTRDEFLSGIRDAFSDDPDFDAEAAFREMVAVMKLHVSAGEMEALRRAMPDPIKALWEDEPPA